MQSVECVYALAISQNTVLIWSLGLRLPPDGKKTTKTRARQKRGSMGAVSGAPLTVTAYTPYTFVSEDMLNRCGEAIPEAATPSE